MRLTDGLCKRFHIDAWTPRPQNNKREERKFFVAVWCYRCRRVRLFEYWKCDSCGQFYKPEIYGKHAADCRLVIAATKINATVADEANEVQATEGDFTYLFEVAREHGLGEADCMRIAHAETHKALADFTRAEVIAFARRICGGSHVEPTAYTRQITDHEFISYDDTHKRDYCAVCSVHFSLHAEKGKHNGAVNN